MEARRVSQLGPDEFDFAPPRTRNGRRPKTRRSAAYMLATRIALLTLDLARGHSITSAQIRKRFGVSKPTAKRDMALLARVLGHAPLESGEQVARVLRLELPNQGGSV